MTFNSMEAAVGLIGFINSIGHGKYDHIKPSNSTRIDITIGANQQSISTLVEVGNGNRRAVYIEGTPTIDDALENGRLFKQLLEDIGYTNVTYDPGEFDTNN